MSTTQPIRSINDIARLKKYFFDKGEIRNYAMIVLGLNTSLRISDVLNLRWKDVYDFERKKYKRHLIIVEKKTKKTNILAINKSIVEALQLLKEENRDISPDTYIIKSRCGKNQPICRSRAFSIIKEAADHLKLGDFISCHSLRKTFGYQAWKKGVPPALLMAIYNHSSIEITKRYLCIDQDDKDKVFRKINL